MSGRRAKQIRATIRAVTAAAAPRVQGDDASWALRAHQRQASVAARAMQRHGIRPRTTYRALGLRYLPVAAPGGGRTIWRWTYPALHLDHVR